MSERMAGCDDSKLPTSHEYEQMLCLLCCPTRVHAVVQLSAFGPFALALGYVLQPLLMPQHHLD